MNFWIARDESMVAGEYRLCVFTEEPKMLRNGIWWIQGKGRNFLPAEVAPDLKPGEKRYVALTPRIEVPKRYTTHEPQAYKNPFVNGK